MSDWIENIMSAWNGHRKFAEWLVQVHGVKTAVELGVDRGYSLFCLANAGIEKIYGIDLWQPDPRFNYGYDNYKPLLEQLSTQHGLSHRIELIRGEFGEVAKTWNRGKVDLIHIDGTHIYEDVKADFNNWSPFVNDHDGIIIMHDVCIPHFTVKPFFNEIQGYHKAWFDHSAGLGVVCKNPDTLLKIVEAFPHIHLGNIE